MEAKQEEYNENNKNFSNLTLGSLITELVNLLDSAIVNQHENAKFILTEKLKYISFRNGNDKFSRNEQEFFNLVQNLINQQTQKINEFVLDYLKNISLGEQIQDQNQIKLENDHQNKEIQNLRQDLNALNSKLSKFMTMTPISPINIPTSNGVHKIPYNIPDDATHILLRCWVQTGYNNDDIGYHVYLSNSLGHQYYFTYHIYVQNAWSYNSENIWMEICPERMVRIEGNGKKNPINLQIAAYK